MGEKGCVKVWDTSCPGSTSPLSQLDCLSGDKYICSGKVLPGGCTLTVEGVVSTLSIWDLSAATSHIKAELTSSSPLPPPRPQPCSLPRPGRIRGLLLLLQRWQHAVWDLHKHTLVRQFQGHAGEASCTDISNNGTKLWAAAWTARSDPGACARLHLTDPLPGRLPSREWLPVGLDTSRGGVLH